MGSLIGGFLKARFGWSWAYRIMSIAAFVTGSSYLLFNIFYIRKKNNSTSIQNGKSDFEEPVPQSTQNDRQVAKLEGKNNPSFTNDE